MEERRLHPRLNLPLESHYSLDGSDLEQAATMLDLSAGGAGIQLPRELKLGAQLDFRFLLPPDGNRPPTPILARAEVVRTQRLENEEGDFGFLTGLRFVELGADSLQRIQQFVFARLTKGSPQADEMPLERRRVEIQTPISIRFDRFDEFESEVSENLSLGGMFICSDHPKSPGTVFTFEHQLGEDFPLVSGRAEVVWTRTRRQGPRMAPGMGVRFLDLDETSRSVIRRLVESRQPEGEKSSVAEDRRTAGKSKPHRISRPVKKSLPSKEEDLKAENDKLRQELARRTRDFSDQEERLKQQIMELTNREVEHQDRLRAIQSSLETTESRAHELEELLADRERRLVDAGYEQEGLTARLREASGARESLALELEALGSTRQEELAALRANLDAATTGDTERRQKIEELAAENTAARRRLEDLEYRESELRKDNEEARDELERARRALRTAAEDTERAAGSQEELVQRVEAREAEIEALRSDLGQTLEAGRDTEKLLLAELGSTRTEYERLEGELDSARSLGSEREAMEAELRERLDAALADVERERENSQKIESELRAELLQAIAKAEQLAAEAEDTADTADAALAAKTAELGAALRQSQAEHREGIETLEAANRGLNAKIARLEAAEQVPHGEPQPPTAELLLEPVGPIFESVESVEPVEPEVEPDPPHRRRSRIAVVALLGAAAIATVLLSPMGEKVRSVATNLWRVSDSPAAPPISSDAEQTKRRERLAGSEPQSEPAAPLEAESGSEPKTDPETFTAVQEAARRVIETTEFLEPEPEPIEEPAVVVGQWATAWSAQRVDDYLGFYATDFVPAKGMSRTDWEAYRRDRLTAPRSISVSLDGMRQETVGEDRVEVVFDQGYKADAYSDRVRKTLTLVLEDGGWRIAGETAEPIPQ